MNHSECDTTKVKVLIVDDDLDVRTPIRLGLELGGFEVLESENGAAALSVVESQSPAVVFIDQGLPDMLGLDVARIIKKLRSKQKPLTAMLTGADSAHLRDAATEIGVNAFFLKPVSIRSICDWIKESLDSSIEPKKS
jgi:DNA-binding response OmpR family regulator